MNKITFLITVYNEVKTVKKAIEDVINIRFPNKEIIIIDNGSTDGSQKIIKNFQKKNNITIILREKNLGFAASILEGIKKSKGDYIYIQYSDLEYDHERSIYMMNYAIKNKLDVVIGSRLKNIKKLKIFYIIKKPAYLATLICTFLINIFYKKNFTDIIGGKLYKTESIKKIKADCYDAGFDFEFMSKICKERLKVGEVSIKYWPRKNSADKKIKFYHMFNALYQIFKVKFLVN
jgi:glycosyltransferase involved in cell wall biosynthesis